MQHNGRDSILIDLLINNRSYSKPSYSQAIVKNSHRNWIELHDARPVDPFGKLRRQIVIIVDNNP